MKKHLFYTFLVIFGFTAAITLLGILGVGVHIEPYYLKRLFSALLIELVVAVIGLYKKTDFFEVAPPPSQSETQNLAESLQHFITGTVTGLLVSPFAFFLRGGIVLALLLGVIGAFVGSFAKHTSVGFYLGFAVATFSCGAGVPSYLAALGQKTALRKTLAGAAAGAISGVPMALLIWVGGLRTSLSLPSYPLWWIGAGAGCIVGIVASSMEG